MILTACGPKNQLWNHELNGGYSVDTDMFVVIENVAEKVEEKVNVLDESNLKSLYAKLGYSDTIKTNYKKTIKNDDYGFVVFDDQKVYWADYDSFSAYGYGFAQDQNAYYYEWFRITNKKSDNQGWLSFGGKLCPGNKYKSHVAFLGDMIYFKNFLSTKMDSYESSINNEHYDNVKLIHNYYQAINEKDWETAFAFKETTQTLEEFTDINKSIYLALPYDFRPLDNSKYKFNLMLIEKNKQTNYYILEKEIIGNYAGKTIKSISMKSLIFGISWRSNEEIDFCNPLLWTLWMMKVSLQKDTLKFLNSFWITILSEQIMISKSYLSEINKLWKIINLCLWNYWNRRSCQFWIDSY